MLILKGRANVPATSQVGRALTALAVDFDLPVDVMDGAAARVRLEETFRGDDADEDDDDQLDEDEDEFDEDIGGARGRRRDRPGLGVPPSRHRPELVRLWAQLVELRGGGDRGASALDATLAQCSTLPVLLHLRLAALGAAGRRSGGKDGKDKEQAKHFLEKLDL